MANGTFDYIKFDKQSTANQASIKEVFTTLETVILHKLNHSRYRALAITALEEAYSWVGKAVREDQLKRGGENELEEKRSDS
jgi:hypothetical protein